MESDSKSKVSSNTLSWTQRCAAHGVLLPYIDSVASLASDGVKSRRRECILFNHLNQRIYILEEQLSETAEDDTETAENDILPEL